MAVKNLGISDELLICPGETIADLLEERGITQKELAQRVGTSEAFLSSVIHGKKDISRGLAKGLEYALGVPSSFWLNLQANYDAEVLERSEEQSVEPTEKEVLASISDVVRYLRIQKILPDKLAQEQKVIRLRKYFQISNLVGLKTMARECAFRFPENTKIDYDVLGAWMCLCSKQASEKKMTSCFDPEKIGELVKRIRKIRERKPEDTLRNLKQLLFQYGIDFGVLPAFRGAPVQGWIVRKRDDTYQMVLGMEDVTSESFWFSLFHEIGHIVNGDLGKSGPYVDGLKPRPGEKETLADDFARQCLGNVSS